MNTKPYSAAPGGRALVVTRVADGQWHVLDDDLVAGRGHAARRPDGRMFVSIDAWHRAAFDRLAEVMVTELPGPLHTVVGEADVEATADWHRFGFTIRRREWEFVVPTAPGGAESSVAGSGVTASTVAASSVAGAGVSRVPAGVRIIPAGEADEKSLRALDRTVRAEVEADVGWHSMPAEVRPRTKGDTIVDPSRYAVAAALDRYLGLVRVVTATRQPRIGLVAVRADERRRGIARALLSHVLETLHRSGVAAASAEVDESNKAALALFEGLGGRRTSSILELAR
jgi:GNAT superfamily N-acetyltransferase